MDQQEDFWKTLDKVRTGLIQFSDINMPMTHFCDAATASLYFVTSKGTQTADSARDGISTKYLICSDGKGFYADISGELSVDTSEEKLAEIWNVFASAWFDGDMNDPDVCRVRMKLTQANIWRSTGNPIAFFYEIAKANLTDQQPALGSQDTITFT